MTNEDGFAYFLTVRCSTCHRVRSLSPAIENELSQGQVTYAVEELMKGHTVALQMAEGVDTTELCRCLDNELDPID